MKKIALVTCCFLMGAWWLLPAVEGQGRRPGPPPRPAPVVVRPAPHPVAPRPVVVTPSINPGIRPVAPVHPVHPGPVVQLPPNRPVVVNKPVVVAPARPPVTVRKDMNSWLERGKGPAVVRRPVAALPKERANVIHANWQRALAKPRVNVNYAARYRPMALQIQNHYRPYVNTWFNQKWWGPHLNFGPNYYWHYSHYFNRHPYYYWWRPATWLALTGWYGAPWGPPIYYDYGNNVVYGDGMVYVNDVPVAPPEEFAQQAFDLANVTPPPPDQQLDYLPLGVFAMTTSMDDTQPPHVLQLAMTKDGLISGTYFNTSTNTVVAVQGRVDPATQRVAIQFEGKDDMVLETGIDNLTQDQTPVLVHFGLDQTQTWYLVRMQSDQKE